MKDIVILGAGGLAREVAFLIEEINKEKSSYNLLGFVVNDSTLQGAIIGKYKVVGDEDWLANQNINAALGIGDPKINSKIISKFADKKDIFFPNLIHPKTVWDIDRIKLGKGNVICAGNIFTTDIEIGSFNIFNLNSTYGHDIKICDCSVFNPGLNISGGVSIGSRCLIGTGATILQYIEIGSDVLVGAGSVVNKNVTEGGAVAGMPARLLIKRIKEDTK
jgi:sugar O-acyltransferase (sialic acid O-acetyltransferase NeuD family)